ncbi:hypothetical protein EELLY_v1c03690 [Entomoplasma ellychniae]|uniref:Uncharacterized protein n=1 Tax=Entomoplasma ellychniae TaxID=2114 RepID=A0A8E2QXB2_9MOLU|nr:hypothetical protein [Entomoplasma ellychniae]PPE04350.1 hypothetical protein EELLY_v1c00240 [Entomoplasma ellychniae]PPE04618.1 hypothetical protein EELLY_v1c02980 [Entomoplasma ellychniae]PPE04689.1 hypothetical protein EELLY_v1c03690 [Entomoplasma ellychniae]
MIKSEYIKDFSFRTNLTQKQSKKILESVYVHLIEVLIDQQEVFTHIGKFYIDQQHVHNQFYKGQQKILKIKLNKIERGLINERSKK